jgi:hypothetical protein
MRHNDDNNDAAGFNKDLIHSDTAYYYQLQVLALYLSLFFLNSDVPIPDGVLLSSILRNITTKTETKV